MELKTLGNVGSLSRPAHGVWKQDIYGTQGSEGSRAIREIREARGRCIELFGNSDPKRPGSGTTGIADAAQ